jgi:transketolase
VAIIAAGITVHEALKAADTLAGDGISVRVIDAYSIKPIDTKALLEAGERLVTVEDHWPEGGLGDAVLEVVADTDEPPRVVKLAVREMPRSGTPAECLAAAGIDADHIAAAARKLVAQTVRAG